MSAMTNLGRSTRRVLFAVMATGLLSVIVVAQRDVSAPWWVFPVFGLGPDLAFLAGIGAMDPLERGQMPPRAVPVYNALHRIWLPAALAALAGLGVVPDLFLVGALVWGFHIALDRAIGYTLRAPDGWLRG
jgi:hypothetical protein